MYICIYVYIVSCPGKPVADVQRGARDPAELLQKAAPREPRVLRKVVHELRSLSRDARVPEAFGRVCRDGLRQLAVQRPVKVGLQELDCGEVERL